MKRFQVIGGAFGFKNYGESDTLRGAKMIASRKEHPVYGKPCIYLSSDCFETEKHGAHPELGAKPVSIWRKDGKTWEDFSPVFGEI